MTITYPQLVQSLAKQEYQPAYAIDGEEGFFLDRITDHFEHRILAESERDFNLHILYGKDATFQDVINTCRRFPMFAERQVVILKEATQMREVAELLSYFENPAATTIFLMEYRGKKLDGKTKLAKAVAKHAVYYHAEKLREEAIPKWLRDYGREAGFDIGQQEAELMTMLLGADLQKLANEIDKVRLNAPDEKVLSMALIKRFIGYSHEYSVFELPELMLNGGSDKLARVLQSLVTSPKAAPGPLVIGTLYNFFIQLYKASAVQSAPHKEAIAQIGGFWKGAEAALKAVGNLNRQQVEDCLLLTADYNAKYMGMDSNAEDPELLKELVGQLVDLLRPARAAAQVVPHL